MQRLRAPQWRDWSGSRILYRLWQQLRQRRMYLRFRSDRRRASPHRHKDSQLCTLCRLWLARQTHEFSNAKPMCYGTTGREVRPWGRAAADGMWRRRVTAVSNNIPGHGPPPRGQPLLNLPLVNAPARPRWMPMIRALQGAERTLPMVLTAHLVDDAMSQSCHVVTGDDEPDPRGTSALTI